jgi:hypothetical protein
MNCRIETTERFDKDANRLAKKYRGLAEIQKIMSEYNLDC